MQFEDLLITNEGAELLLHAVDEDPITFTEAKISDWYITGMDEAALRAITKVDFDSTANSKHFLQADVGMVQYLYDPESRPFLSLSLEFIPKSLRAYAIALFAKSGHKDPVLFAIAPAKGTAVYLADAVSGSLVIRVTLNLAVTLLNGVHINYNYNSGYVDQKEFHLHVQSSDARYWKWKRDYKDMAEARLYSGENNVFEIRNSESVVLPVPPAYAFENTTDVPFQNVHPLGVYMFEGVEYHFWTQRGGTSESMERESDIRLCYYYNTLSGVKRPYLPAMKGWAGVDVDSARIKQELTRLYSTVQDLHYDIVGAVYESSDGINQEHFRIVMNVYADCDGSLQKFHTITFYNATGPTDSSGFFKPVPIFKVETTNVSMNREFRHPYLNGWLCATPGAEGYEPTEYRLIKDYRDPSKTVKFPRLFDGGKIEFEGGMECWGSAVVNGIDVAIFAGRMPGSNNTGLYLLLPEGVYGSLNEEDRDDGLLGSNMLNAPYAINIRKLAAVILTDPYPGNVLPYGNCIVEESARGATEFAVVKGITKTASVGTSDVWSDYEISGKILPTGVGSFVGWDGKTIYSQISGETTAGKMTMTFPICERSLGISGQQIVVKDVEGVQTFTEAENFFGGVKYIRHGFGVYPYINI